MAVPNADHGQSERFAFIVTITKRVNKSKRLAIAQRLGFKERFSVTKSVGFGFT